MKNNFYFLFCLINSLNFKQNQNIKIKSARSDSKVLREPKKII